MTKRDFILISSVIRDSTLPLASKYIIAAELATKFAISNPAFDIGKFMLACQPQPAPSPTQHPMFRDHNCWKCTNGTQECVEGNPSRCEYPHAKND